jgi:hypothetical protein
MKRIGDTKVLIALWLAQAGYSVICCIVGGVLIQSKVNEVRYDDGDSDMWYLMYVSPYHLPHHTMKQYSYSALFLEEKV